MTEIAVKVKNLPTFDVALATEVFGRIYQNLIKRSALAILLMACAGCQSELYSRLTEREANEIIAALWIAGIDAIKQPVDEKNWSVMVSKGDIGAALQILQQQGLPQERFASLGEVFKKEGLVSTPSEERIRYIYAVSQELSNTLTQIDGVVSARVHVVIPANDPLSNVIKPSAASVFVKHRAGADLQAIAPAIKNLVMHSIEGLTYENISLSLFTAQRNSTPDTMAQHRPSWFAGVIGVAALSALLALVGLLYRYREVVRSDWSDSGARLKGWWRARRAGKAA